MGVQPTKRHISAGMLAHVDAGKTTLCEALLYRSGMRRTLGRVDHRDAYLDTHALERARGITIFSKQAIVETADVSITLVDTPGHADFAAEAERSMMVLDCAVLLISATDGVQAHTVTLWNLLQRYHIPVFLFINKMDLPGAEQEKLMAQLQQKLSPNCVDFTLPEAQRNENAALCDEALLETYLADGNITDGNLRGLIAKRKLFPCCFGSALKLEGIDAFLDTLNGFAPEKDYGNAFGGLVYKISRDSQGNRLTWLKVTGGSLAVRSPLTYTDRRGDSHEEKAAQLRLYSGDKFTAAEQVSAGALCAVTGLTATYIGQGLGVQADRYSPMLEPVMTYRIGLPGGCDPLQALPKLRQLEEEDPLLRLVWDSRSKQIYVQIMGKIQLEVLRSLIEQRFSLLVTLDSGRIFYKETIANTVEGVGHYEPLRHYAEVHLLLSPLPVGSGLVFDTTCPTDVLEAHYQNLILTHLAEKTHLGVTIGAPITDMKITLSIGRAHIKHTEGGDFRQATYRAVRQGLMQAKSVILEPWYDFVLTVPTAQIGRAIADIRAMHGQFDTPQAVGTSSTLKGTVPAATLGDYPAEVAAYTQGHGQLQLSLHGYAPCHNPEAVIAEIGYDPLADIDNTPDSIFCDHGAGFHVSWNQVSEYMHLELTLKNRQSGIITSHLQPDDKSLEAIMQKQFGNVTTQLYRPKPVAPADEKLTIRPPRQKYLIVDGYNIIFAWDDLKDIAKSDLDTARSRLLDILSSYAGYKKCRLIVVFDGYKVKGNPGEKLQFHNIQVVYTAEGETADAYIEALVHEIGNNYAVHVATSDSLVQLASLRSGVLRMSARELKQEIWQSHQDMEKYFSGKP